MTATEAQLRTMAQGWAVHAANAAARREKFAYLRKHGVTVANAAVRLQVSTRTAERYELWRKARAS